MKDELAVVGAAILDGPTCLVTQRGEGMAMPLKWEFPGGKVEPGERPEAALARELEEELGIVVEVGDLLATGRDHRATRTIVLDVYRALLVGGDLLLREHASHRWASAEELMRLDWATADRKPARVVADLLRTRAARRT